MFKGIVQNEIKGTVAHNIQLAVDDTIAKFQQKQNTSDADTVVRPLAPQDFTTASTQKSWSFTNVTNTGNTANAIVNISVPDDKYLIIYGVSIVNASVIDQIDITRSGSTARFWNVEWSANQDAINAIYFDNPVVIESNQNLTVNLYASATGTLTCVFFGTVVEERGLNIGC